jgi:hypothetical protein
LLELEERLAGQEGRLEQLLEGGGASGVSIAEGTELRLVETEDRLARLESLLKGVVTPGPYQDESLADFSPDQGCEVTCVADGPLGDDHEEAAPIEGELFEEESIQAETIQVESMEDELAAEEFIAEEDPFLDDQEFEQPQFERPKFERQPFGNQRFELHPVEAQEVEHPQAELHHLEHEQTFLDELSA